MHKRSRSGRATGAIGALRRILGMADVRSGCFTCRLRRKKCDEGKPCCKACKHLGLKCEYKRPLWWSNNDQRKKQKEVIKNIIKRTKLSEKSKDSRPAGVDSPPGLTHSLPTSATYSDAACRTRAASEDSQYSLDFNGNPMHESFDMYAPQVFTPHFDSHPHDPSYSSHPPPYQGYPPAPYEVDVKTERQTYVNDVPMRRDSMVSTFSTFHPPPTSNLAPVPEDEWLHEDIYEQPNDMFSADEEGLDLNFFDFPHGPAPHSSQRVIRVDECDKHLLEHFVENVLRLIFPVLEVNQHGSARSEIILPALETNKTYLHCCLSIAAIHLKSTQGTQGEQIDADIVRHRYATVSELCEALNRDTDHAQILEATLGMIFFQCSVGRPDDCLPDIPWHQHFQAASSLVRKLELPEAIAHVTSTQMHPQFNTTLTSWIDILGATMLGQAPHFANTYRDKHLSASSSGLMELMGCEDRTMYLISEIACLEALKIGNILDSNSLCSHITLLGQQMDAGEPSPTPFEYAVSSSGAVRPKQLSRNMTIMFKIAARAYLCSLVPGASRGEPSTMNLVAQFADLLEYIPSGPEGFDRSIVWPLLVTGAQSTPGSSFRTVMADRIAKMGEQAEFGSFGRMVRLLQEVWRLNDEEGQNVHWRDVMRQNGWDFLLI